VLSISLAIPPFATGVTVGFTSESYTTSEDEGGVEVCVAVLAGEASTPILLTVVTADGTATSKISQKSLVCNDNEENCYLVTNSDCQ